MPNSAGMDFKLFWVGIFIFLIACNPSDYRDPRNKCEWFLKNSTGSTIILLKNFDSPNYNIVPNDSTRCLYCCLSVDILHILQGISS